MDDTVPSRALSHAGAMRMMAAAVAEAEAMGRPQCVSIVDAGCLPVLELRMTGAKPLSRRSARAKAVTAASNGAPSEAVPEAVRPAIAAATGGAVTGLAGGLPIVVEGALLGGIGVGSGTPEEDLRVARAALRAVGAETAR